ncbi:hypothetical protein [Mycobacterium paraense]|uniref:hypothetical protein n=1 Tax=Mycobacterium paraense TaxID=767916 RepID=UPI0013019D34|nr:hypothetical protein [Mycobacterium paraense]
MTMRAAQRREEKAGNQPSRVTMRAAQRREEKAGNQPSGSRVASKCQASEIVV